MEPTARQVSASPLGSVHPFRVRVGVYSTYPLHRDAITDTLAALTAAFDVSCLNTFPELAESDHDVLVVDVHGQGFERIRRSVAGWQPTVCWGGYPHGTVLDALVEQGVRGYVSIIGSQNDLVVACQRVALGGTALPQANRDRLRLTAAELRVCRVYLGEAIDSSRADVAKRLGLSERTLKVHIANVRKKADGHSMSRVELRRVLRAQGILDDQTRE